MGQMKRKQLLIDPLFQVRFIIKFCSIIIVASLLIGGFVYLLTRDSTTVAIENTKVLIKPTADFILPNLSMTVLIVAFFSALTGLFLSLIMSHRIAGPVFRLQREILRMREGDLRQKFNIRNRDELQTLAASLRLMTDTFRTKLTVLREAYNTLAHSMEEKGLSAASDEKKELQKVLDEMNEALNYFKV